MENHTYITPIFVLTNGSTSHTCHYIRHPSPHYPG